MAGGLAGELFYKQLLPLSKFTIYVIFEVCDFPKAEGTYIKSMNCIISEIN